MNKKLPPLFSVILLNWNRLEDTLVCLEHVRKLDYPNIEIIVVDNGSTDGSKKTLPKLKDIIYVDNPKNRGFTGGHIDGLARAKGEFIVLLNNDAVIKHDYLNRALAHLQQDETIGAIGGRAYFWDDANPLLSESNRFYSYQTVNVISAEAISHQLDNGIVQEVNNVSGSCVVVRRSVIDAIGYLYDPFFAYYEETDLFARMKRAGFKVLYDPKLAIWHKSGVSSSSSFQYHQLFRNRFMFAVRNFDKELLPAFIKSYLKTGLSSTIWQLRPDQNQNLHRAFAKAFWRNVIYWPVAFMSRHQLSRQLPGSYSRKLVSEQYPLSVVVDFTNHHDMQALAQWQEFSSQHPRHDFVAVHHKNSAPKLKPSQPLRSVIDNEYFDTHAVNLGWLSAKNEYIYLTSAEQPLPNIQELENAVWRLYQQDAWAALHLGEQTEQPAAPPGILCKKDLLIRHGGFEGNVPFEQALYQLLAYAALWQPSKLVDSGKELALAALADLTKTDLSIIETTITRRALSDKHSQKSPGRWYKLLERHYRLYQTNNLVRWLISPKIKPRLKLGRSKNLILYALSRNNKGLATELKHIRNEVLKISYYGVDIVAQNKYVKKLLPSLMHDWQNIPVFIICRDRLETLQQLLAWLEKAGMNKIVLIDNDSVYPPLVHYLAQTKHQVIRTMQNVGHTVPWSGGVVKTLVPNGFYIISDPDVIPIAACPVKEVIPYFLQLHKKYFAHQKVGFGLKIDDLPDHYHLKEDVMNWEGQFWQTELEPNVFEAGVDTTFALYKPFLYNYIIHPSIRTGHPYTARHLPWYVDSNAISAEEKFYRDRVSNAITSWNVEELDERYKAEFNKNSANRSN